MTHNGTKLLHKENTGRMINVHKEETCEAVRDANKILCIWMFMLWIYIVRSPHFGDN